MAAPLHRPASRACKAFRSRQSGRLQQSEPADAPSPAGSRGGNPNVASHSIVFESEDPKDGVWEAVSEFGFGDPENKTVFEMVGFGDHLYVGTFNLGGYEIWRSTCEGPKPYPPERPSIWDARRRTPRTTYPEV